VIPLFYAKKIRISKEPYVVLHPDIVFVAKKG
jgi:hypothetical protein